MKVFFIPRNHEYVRLLKLHLEQLGVKVVLLNLFIRSPQDQNHPCVERRNDDHPPLPPERSVYPEEGQIISELAPSFRWSAAQDPDKGDEIKDYNFTISLFISLEPGKNYRFLGQRFQNHPCALAVYLPLSLHYEGFLGHLQGPRDKDHLGNAQYLASRSYNRDRENSRWFFERANGIIYHSRSDLQRVKEMLGTSIDKVYLVVPHGNFNESYPNTITQEAARDRLSILCMSGSFCALATSEGTAGTNI